MSKVLIIVNAEVNHGQVSKSAPVTIKMVSALSQVISHSSPSLPIEIVGAADLWSKSPQLKQNWQNSTIYCPLTIELPDWLNFPAKNVFQLCKDLEGRRSWVEQNFNYKTSTDNSWLGDLWLPIILTAKGPVYAEVIGEGEIPNSYQQPIDFPDHLRQSLYHLAYSLLESINAIPAVYLLQFKMLKEDIVFDRLWPFPATPAIASIHRQNPDLFACHWDCLTHQPFTDVTIFP
jgi:hypothetical protein